ncbi:hypothetical protein OCOJLMKI_1974 [Methylobacterium iners]|uniref:Uncharacterized protein n=2 Tax=Methylobacterium iners TaxID=418707 RepID=A0ABQ4RZ19_9HYPH|nr:hypothetical protein OCOJLMKI_1974 [Methylobacterium iners]
MITLLLTLAAAGAANVALVAFLADRVGSKAGTAVSAGEFVALAPTAPAASKVSAVKVGNQNVPAGALKRAA